MNKFLTILLAAVTALFIAACGTKGPLTPPPGPAPEPLLGNPKPAQAIPPQNTVSDLSTDPKARPQ
jgi:predicted small lipoprotein YifL